MSELTDMAFQFCSKAKKKGLRKCDVLWLVEIQFNHVENMEFDAGKLDELIREGESHE